MCLLKGSTLTGFDIEPRTPQPMTHLSFDTYYLDNGLKVIIHRMPGIGKVVADIVYRVGAKHENPERTGFAHLFEHLMFEGSKHIPHYDVHVEKAGGNNNAFTTNDITNYYLQLPANQLETALWLESDRMLELDFNQKSLDVQKSVVIEEFKQRYLNQPYGRAYLELRPLMFEQHPYRWMTIGKEVEHIEQATLEEVKDFFFHFYAPNNATLILAGDIRSEDAMPLVEKWFGSIPRRELGKRPLPEEPPQNQIKHKDLYATDIPLTQVYKAWHIPARAADDYPPAEIWSELMTGGKNAWFYQKLVVEKKVAAGIGAFSWGLHDTGKFSLNAQLVKGVSPQEYEEALQEAFHELEQVGTAELERQKNKLSAVETLEKLTAINRAQALAIYDTLGDPNLFNTELERYLALTPQDLHHFRESYFRPSNCTTLNYLPAA